MNYHLWQNNEEVVKKICLLFMFTFVSVQIAISCSKAGCRIKAL